MDEAISHLINQQWTNPALDLFMAVMSDSEIWKPLLILIALLALIFGRFKARACLLCLLLTLLIAEQVTGFLKTAVDRRRPKQIETVRMVELAKVKPAFLKIFHKPAIRFSDESDRNLSRSGPSFPSGHTTDNTVIAMCLTLFYPRRGWLYWIVTAVIAYSRIYLGAHWPSDVLGTFFLAVGETLVILGLFELLWRWAAPRWLPAVYQNHPSLLGPAQ
jgi:undecaprenyl-diphosphatase